MKSRKSSRRGYALLFAVLTAVLVLGVAAFIAGVARKQYILAATARDSLFSFYNADSAIGCVSTSWNGASSTSNISCNGDAVSVTTNPFSKDNVVLPAGSSFSGNYPVYKSSNNSIAFNLNGGCAIFDVWVGYDTAQPVANEKRVIEARGYNICSANPVSPASGAVERAIRFTQ